MSGSGYIEPGTGQMLFWGRCSVSLVAVFASESALTDLRIALEMVWENGIYEST